MLSFKDYLVEAQFSEDDFARVLNVFERRLPKLLGASLYRYGGSDGIVHYPGFSEIIYIYGDRAFAVRFKGGHIIGLPVYTHYSVTAEPDYFIDVNELSAPTLISSISKVASLIRKPQVGNFKVDEVNESVKLDEMAKRISDKTFYDMMVQKYGADKAKSVTWAQIKTVADENDVLIPAYIRSQKVGRGLWNSEPGAGSTAPASDEDGSPEEGTTKVVGKGKDILYIKVTAQDPETKRFKSASDSKEAQALYAQIADSMADHKPTEKEMRDPETLYGHLSQLVDMACKGTLRSLLIYGGPGTGKTYTIMKTIKEAGLLPGKDYVKLSGKASPLSIYQTLFMYRDGGLVVFDDLDSMWGNQDATNILKAALDTSPIREISWASSNTINVAKMDDEDRQTLFAKIDQDIEEKPEKVKFPSQFDFTGRVIFISNLKKEEFDTAIMSRSAKINMDLTPEEVLQRMRQVLPTLGGEDVTIKQKEELLDHLLVMHKTKEISALTMRDFVKGLNIVRSGAPNWRDLLRYA